MIHIFFIFSILLSSLLITLVTSSHCTTTTNTKTFEKCMSLPTQQASIAWTYHAHNATLDLAFFSSFISPSGWVGWGINPTSLEMTGSHVLVAFPDPNSGQLVLMPNILDSSVKLEKSPLLSHPLGIHLLTSSVTMYGGHLTTIHNGAQVQIYAKIKLTPNKTKINCVWNRGVYVQGYSPTIHPTTVNDLSSTTTIDLLSGVSRYGTNLNTLKKVHGVMNAISWGVMLPIGIVTSRYLRDIKSLGPTWFYLHAGMQLTGFFLGTIGFAIGVRLGELSPGKVYGLHRTLGFIAFCLRCLQTLALLFRPRTTNNYRKYWKSYHHFVGYACMVLGVVNVFQGFQVMEASRSYAKLSYCLCLSTIISECVALEVNSWIVFCRKAEEEKLRREGVTVGGNDDKGNIMESSINQHILLYLCSVSYVCIS